MKRDRSTAGLDIGLKEEELGPIRPPNPGFQYIVAVVVLYPSAVPSTGEPMEVEQPKEEEEPMDTDDTDSDEGYMSIDEDNEEETTLSSSFRRLSMSEQ
jgi:hypothetical protein